MESCKERAKSSTDGKQEGYPLPLPMIGKVLLGTGNTATSATIARARATSVAWARDRMKPAKMLISRYLFIQTTFGVSNESHSINRGLLMQYLPVNQSELPLANKLLVAEELMDVTLQVQLGPWIGRKIRVPVGQSVKVGRSPQSDIAFANDAYMSRTHFSLDWDDTACWINDLNSHHGTFVNGKKVQKAPLRDGDTIRVGWTVLVVRFRARESSHSFANCAK
jgi:hypothetical protein